MVSSAQGCTNGGCGTVGWDGCGTSCGDGCGFFSRWRGMFHRNSCDSCNTCDTCSTGHSWGGRFGGLFHRNSCDTCNTCNTCDTGCGGGLFGGGRLRGLFSRHRNDCCDTCDGGCYGCANGTVGSAAPAPTPIPGTVMPAPTGEQLVNPPKKMPTPPPATKPAPAPAPQKQTRISTPAVTTPAVPATPNIEVVPPPVRSLEAERRDPPF